MWQSLGTNYSAEWSDRRTLTITITDATGAGPPAIGHFTLTVRSETKLRNFPDASVPAAVASPPLQGNFGSSTIEIEKLVASDPTGSSWRYDAGDRITVVFNRATDRAGYGSSTMSKENVDALISFATDHAASQTVYLGADYTGMWTDDHTLVIEVVNASTASPPTIPQPLSADGSIYSLPHLDAIGLGLETALFQVQWTEDCLVFGYGCSADGQLQFQNFDNAAASEAWYDTLVAAQTNLSILAPNVLSCNYPARPLSRVRDVVLIRGESVLAASIWAQIRFQV